MSEMDCCSVPFGTFGSGVLQRPRHEQGPVRNRQQYTGNSDSGIRCTHRSRLYRSKESLREYYRNRWNPCYFGCSLRWLQYADNAGGARKRQDQKTGHRQQMDHYRRSPAEMTIPIKPTQGILCLTESSVLRKNWRRLFRSWKRPEISISSRLPARERWLLRKISYLYVNICVNRA